jgi:magnesium-transporting ATPase (P-type)
LKAPDFETLVNNIISFLLTLALVLVPMIIIIGAYFIMTAGGDPGKVAKGKNIIIYSLIALAIILLAKSLVAIIKEIFGVK